MKPLHVYPMGQPHVMHSGCWCRPRVSGWTDRPIYTHKVYQPPDTPACFKHRDAELVPARTETVH